MLDFNNTKIAFANKSDWGLKKAYYLFKLVSLAWLSKIAIGLLKLSISLRLPVKGMIKSTVFEHFCGGEDIQDCEGRIQELAQYNVKTILDYSVEGKQSESDFNQFLKEAMGTVDQAKSDQHIPFCVFKVTALIPFKLLKKVSSNKPLSDEESDVFSKGKERVNGLCRHAHQCAVPILIDAEESWIQDAIDEIALVMMQNYNKDRAIIYNTAQMYRHDRLDYINKIHEQSIQEQFYLGLKIVRGAYMEKERERAARKAYPDPIQKDKASTDHDFNQALRFCLEHIGQIALCLGTHNEDSSMLLARLMDEGNIPKNHPHIYFSQLLGMSDHISFNLAKENYNVAKYVPFGPIKEVMPYLVRRAEENTSISGQTGRELSLIIEEMKRRKRMA